MKNLFAAYNHRALQVFATKSQRINHRVWFDNVLRYKSVGSRFHGTKVVDEEWSLNLVSIK